jgi:Spy/CpxP family protein refolding chaperone
MRIPSRTLAVICCLFSVICCAPFAAAQVPPDRDLLLAGSETGQVRPADANGFPGPRRLLELEKDLTLTPGQKKSLLTLAEETQKRAAELGKRIVRVEEEQYDAFRTGLVSEQSVREDAEQIGRLRGKLRGIHLVAHLKAKKLLTADQRALYRKLKNTEPEGKH